MLFHLSSARCSLTMVGSVSISSVELRSRLIAGVSASLSEVLLFSGESSGTLLSFFLNLLFYSFIPYKTRTEKKSAVQGSSCEYVVIINKILEMLSHEITTP